VLPGRERRYRPIDRILTQKRHSSLRFSVLIGHKAIVNPNALRVCHALRQFGAKWQPELERTQVAVTP
jgi:hypothetical protein